MKNSSMNSLLSRLRSLFYLRNPNVEANDSATMTMIEDLDFDCIYRTTSNEDF